MRPLIAADPMLRAPRPEMVAESTFTDARGGAVCAPAAPASRAASAAAQQLPNRGVIIAQSLAGFWKRRSSIGKFASIFSNVIFCLSSLPLRPLSIEYGRDQPAPPLFVPVDGSHTRPPPRGVRLFSLFVVSGEAVCKF